MTDLDKLPRDITPAELFYDIVPEVLGEVDIPEDAANERVQFHITGDEGLEVSIGMDADGSLTIEPGRCEAPILCITAGIDDFRAFVAGDLRDRILAETGGVVVGPRQIRLLFPPAPRLALIEAYPGDVQLRVVDKDIGRTYVVTVTIGGVTPNLASPKCVVSIDLDKAMDIAAGRALVQQLFFMGDIRVEGDMGTVLGLMGALAAG